MSVELSAQINQLLQYKQLYQNGLMTKDEYEIYRLALIDSVSHTGQQHQPVGPQHQRPSNPVYAGPHFVNTNQDAMRQTEILVITPPVAYNRNLHVPEAPLRLTERQDVVPINPLRGKQLPQNMKQHNESVLLYVENRAGACDSDEQVARLDKERQRLQWELFEAATTNDVNHIKELLDSGASIDQRDHDSEATPLIVAASRGNKHAVYYLVSRGASINAQNFRGETALHESVKLKNNETALWLTSHGGDIDCANFKGYTPYSLALPWLQKELKTVRDEFVRKQNLQIVAVRSQVQTPDISEIIHVSNNINARQKGAYEAKYGVPINKNVVRDEAGNIIQSSESVVVTNAQQTVEIHLKGNSGKLVTAPVSPLTTAKDLCEFIAGKLNASKYANHLEVIESIRGREARLAPNAVISGSMSKWPLSLAPSGNAQCKLIVAPIRGAPEPLTMSYRALVYGSSSA